MTHYPSSLPEPPIVAALLAGGGSRRMGRNKAGVLLGGKPLAHWAAASVAGAAAIRVQIGGAPLPGLGWKVLEDLRPGVGPAGGIETVLACFPGAAAVVCAVDCPFVPPGLLLEQAARLASGCEAAVARTARGWHPLAAAYSPRILPALTGWLDSGRFGLQRFLDGRQVAALEGPDLERFGDPAVILANINTSADLVVAEKVLSGAEFL